MTRAPLALAGLALACAGTAVFVAAGVWVWRVKAEANRQADYIAGRANAAADAADHATGFVGEILGKARAELDVARTRVGSPAPTPVSPIVQITARQASQQLAGSVERALGAIVAASDAVVVIDAALDVVSESPELKQLFGVRPEQVTEVRGTLGSVAAELRQARSVLGVPIDHGPVPTPDQLDAVGDSLRLADGFRAEMARVVQLARDRVNDTRKKVDSWVWRGAWTVTAVAALGVVGQLFTARFFWRKFRRLPA